ncbi:MAG TPA: hypothetical protein PLA59_06020 [Myxococcota bacterium]|jgi:hypothetical protein|nr:hypothetical protein [Myxococcota bacterium]
MKLMFSFLAVLIACGCASRDSASISPTMGVSVDEMDTAQFDGTGCVLSRQIDAVTAEMICMEFDDIWQMGAKIVTVRIGQEGLDFVKKDLSSIAESDEYGTAFKKSVKDAADGESYVKPIEVVLSGSTATLPGTDFTLKVESSNEAFGLAISKDNFVVSSFSQPRPEFHDISLVGAWFLADMKGVLAQIVDHLNAPGRSPSVEGFRYVYLSFKDAPTGPIEPKPLKLTYRNTKSRQAFDVIWPYINGRVEIEDLHMEGDWSCDAQPDPGSLIVEGDNLLAFFGAEVMSTLPMYWKDRQRANFACYWEPESVYWTAEKKLVTVKGMSLEAIAYRLVHLEGDGFDSKEYWVSPEVGLVRGPNIVLEKVVEMNAR